MKNLSFLDLKFSLACSLSSARYQHEFRKRFVNDKESILEGEIDNEDFSLCLRSGLFRQGDFSILTGRIIRSGKKSSIKCKVELTETFKASTILGIIAWIVLVIYNIYSSGFEFKFFGSIILFLSMFIIAIYFILYNDLFSYKRELKRLIYENKSKTN